MSNYDKSRNSSGKKDNVLFLSKNKKPNSANSPPYKGQGSYRVPEWARAGDTVDVWLGAWLGDNQYGSYFKIGLTEKDEQPDRGSQERQRTDHRDARDERQPGSDDDFDDDIPF